jgi:uncharacterized protein
LKLGVISDTHAMVLEEIPASILAALAEVDIIVHAGDFTNKDVLEGLRNLGKVKAVYGNMDSAELKQMLPSRETFEINGKRIGLTHGAGGGSGDIARRVRSMFDDIDIVIYGHSHEPDNQQFQGSLLFNPGPARKSYGLIKIGEELEAKIVPV